ncbi:hypothetical protein JOD43_001711 [Pullulanibacillus pueri]|nr:hypothetical protein [Pullulanibacillus pueri]MBM7681544.1 hypothetical protein [Pullulanibacillus pueri]
MRTDTGYDVMIIAVKNKEGIYRVYKVEQNQTEGIHLFNESDPKKLRPRIRAWCREHLPDEMEMMRFSVKNGRDDCIKIKHYLTDQHIPFELKHHTFFIRRREYSNVKEKIHQLAEIIDE